MFIRTAIAVLAAATVIQSGAALAQTAPQPAGPPAVSAPAQHHHHKRSALFRGLNLSADQKAQIKSIREKYQAQNSNVTDPQQRRASMLARREEIMRVLTPEQRHTVEQRIAAMRNRRHEQSPNGVNPPRTQ